MRFSSINASQWIAKMCEYEYPEGLGSPPLSSERYRYNNIPLLSVESRAMGSHTLRY